jgi:hypothetical protein
MTTGPHLHRATLARTRNTRRELDRSVEIVGSNRRESPSASSSAAVVRTAVKLGLLVWASRV